MKKDLELIIEIIKRQLGYEPTQKEIENMKKLLSVQIKDHKKMKKALNALKEVCENKTCSWYDGQFERNKDCLENTGIYYRGNKISKKDMFERAQQIAASMHANGLKKGDSFSICTSNLPDFITILLATSYIGAKINIFSSDFDKNYIKKIVNSCDSEFIFISDDHYSKLGDCLENTKIKKKILLSLADHLPEEFPKEYVEKKIPRELYDFPNMAIEYQKKDAKITLMDEFIEEGENINKKDIKDKNPNIGDDFTITYSSGTSRPGCPKAIPHRNLSYLTMMRFHDSDMSGLSDLSNIVGLAHIPPISDTNIKSVISDTMSQKSIIACEPIYGEHTLIYSILMNDANFVDATRSSWIRFAKQVLFDERFKDIEFTNLGLPLAVGEPLEINERNFIDKALIKAKAGKDLLKKMGLPLPYTFLGEGGGRTESGGVVYTVFQGLFEKLNKLKLKKGKYGMAPCDFVDIAIIDKNGKECKINEIGEMCADSVCTMSNGEYFFSEDNNSDFNLVDQYGRTWPRFKVYAYRNEVGNIVMKGRMGSEFIVNNKKIPEFIISDIILKDKKRILSCEVINLNNIPIVNIELNPFEIKEKGLEKVRYDTLKIAEKKCQSILPEDLSKNIVYRIRYFEQPFELTGCAKRDVNSIYKEGIKNCLKPIIIDESICLLEAEKYFETRDKKNEYSLVKKTKLMSVFKKKIKKKTKKLDNKNS